MARYRYAGPGPHEQDGQLIRPGDVWEFSDEPDWGPWEPDAPEAAEKPADAPPVQTPAGGADSPPAGSTPPATQNGM